jgi:RimJ/RimL family protein N-acetyltransferase
MPLRVISRTVPNWKPRPRPSREPMTGRLCRVEPLDPARHAVQLFSANAADATGANWTYLAYGPFDRYDDYAQWMTHACASDDPFFHAIVERDSGRAVGVASLMRIDQANGVIEIGHINFSPLLQRSSAATEAIYLMMRRVFELGYRRFEWKCDALNVPSRAAALRFGFSFEGVFRQHVVVKGRNRDTAWYAMIDNEWPALDAAYRRWLDPANFDADGRQLTRLGDLTAAALRR